MKLVAKSLYGLEQVLAEELVSLGATNVKKVNRAVTFSGERALLYKINYCSRTALSVLVNIAEFRIRSKDDLYREGSKIDWFEYLDPDMTFAIVPVVSSTLFTHTGYPGLILKDAIADYFRKKSGRRPSVNTAEPDVLINLHISHDRVTVSLDSSVVPLFKRGYRKELSTAPLNEVLAAGILHISGWNGSSAFYDPMCGSGTFSVEAGMAACSIPPGKLRDFFGFRRWKDFDEALFDNVRNAADSRITEASLKIYASDISEEAVRMAETNIRKAGLQDMVSLSVADFRDVKGTSEGCHLFLNPPYGERLKIEEINELYSMIGSTMKHEFAGSTAWIITSNREALKHVGLKPAEKHVLFNGSLECLLLKYELYSGTKKQNG